MPKTKTQKSQSVKKTQKTRKTRRTTRRPKGFPILQKVDDHDMKYKYKLSKPASKRRLAIHEGIQMESKRNKITRRKAAIAKKGRLNVLRIYRRHKAIDDCKKITKDMKYIDKEYGLGKTAEICGK